MFVSRWDFKPFDTQGILSSEMGLQLCRMVIASFFLALCYGQPGRGGARVGRGMPQTQDGVPLQVRWAPASQHWDPCGVVPASHVEKKKKKKSVANSFNSCTMKITVICIYTLGKFYCCLIYVIILFIPGLFNKTLYLLRCLIVVCFFGYGTSSSVFNEFKKSALSLNLIFNFFSWGIIDLWYEFRVNHIMILSL